MATVLAQKKLREAAFFLGEMCKREGSSRLNSREEFGYLLSAFLSAARSVSFVLRKENPLTYEAQRDQWLASLNAPARLIVDFMRDQRNAALKEGADAAEQDLEHIPVLMDRELSPHLGSAFIVRPWAGQEGATVGVARYILRLKGVEHPAVDLCREYLSALEALVARFA